MPPMLSLWKYSFTNKRSTPLVIYSVLAAVWGIGWLLVWTAVFLAISGEPDGPDPFSGLCAWSILVIVFCLMPLILQMAWAFKTQKEESEEAARTGRYYNSAYPPPAYPPAQYALQPPPAAAGWYPPPPAAANIPAPDALLEEEKRRTRDLEYENALLRRKIKDEEARRRSIPTAERLVEAQGLEMERRYEDAAKAYEELGLWDDAARVRMLQGKGGPL
jgi:hypothetical protein